MSQRARRIATGLALAALAVLVFIAKRKRLLGSGVALAAVSVYIGSSSIPGGGGEPEPGTAHVWVDTDGGGTCDRSSSAVAWNDATDCGSFDAGLEEASAGDTVIARGGDYGSQSISVSKASETTLICAEGTKINVGTNANQGMFIVADHLTVDGCSVAGTLANVRINGSNVVWRNAYLGVENGIGGLRNCTTNLPFEVVGVDGIGMDTLLVQDVVFWPSELDETAGCPTPPPHHETIRLDSRGDGGAVHDITFDRVYLVGGDESNTSALFITKVFEEGVGTPVDPYNIVIQNSIFGTTNADYSVYSHSGVAECIGWEFSYNTFAQTNFFDGCNTTEDVTWTGNLGPRPSFVECWGTYAFNVWQHEFDSSNCGASDSWVAGDSFSTNALGLDANWRLEAGSDAIDAGETPGASDVCTGDLGSVDIDGETRPAGSVCDAGADER
jgi:hypothetical protein